MAGHTTSSATKDLGQQLTTRRWSAREYRQGDGQALQDLHDSVFGTQVSADTWEWQYLRSPAGQAVVVVAESDEGIAGQYALIPLRMKAQGRLCIGGLSLDTMVHPDYRGQGVFLRLAERVYQLAAERGIDFVYGFPNQNSHHAFIARLNWRDLHNGVPIWAKPLNIDSIVQKRFVKSGLIAALGGTVGKVAVNLLSRNSATTGPTCHIRETASFDDRFDSLWNEASSEWNVAVVRDRAYLTWRYVDKPGGGYTILVAERGEELLGYVVLKCVPRFGLEIGLLVDMVWIPGEKGVANALISAGLECFASGKMDLVGCLMLPSAPYSRDLKEMGFFKVPRRLLPQNMYLGGCSLVGEQATASLFKPGNWFVTWGDHDDI
jgi:GNAT superfamily N-acetyltransferase